MEILKIDSQSIKKAVSVIKRGGVIVFPSDTVYGLLCDATNKKAVKELFRIKKRAKENPIGVYVRSIKMAKELAKIDRQEEGILKKFWPGPLTVVLCSKIDLFGISEKQKTIGLRIPDSHLISRVFKEVSCPLAQTSANMSGEPATTKINEVLRYFERAAAKPDLVLDGGDLKEAEPSTVIDLTSLKFKILRRGEIGKKEIMQEIKKTD